MKEAKENKIYNNGKKITVKDFGAIGDGLTDDKEAIQKALDTVGKLGGGELWINKGNYKIIGQLDIKYSNIHLYGEHGAKLSFYGLGARGKDTNGNRSPESGSFLNIAGSQVQPDMIHNIIVKNIIFDGSNQKFKGGSSADDLKTTSIKPFYEAGLTAIRVQGVYFIRIEDCKLYDFYGNGIAVDRSSYVEILDNYLEDCSGNGFGHSMWRDCFGDGIGCWKSSHCYVARNFVYNRRTFLTHEISSNRDVYGYPCGRSGLEFEYPANIDVQRNPERWTPLHLNEKNDPTSYNLTFEQNLVYGYTKGCHLENGVDCRILNNTFIYNHIGLLDATGGNTIVKGNYFTSGGIKSSIQGGYDWYGVCGCAFPHFLGQWFDNAVVDGNVFVGEMNGVEIGRSKITIQNNIFRLTGGLCIGERITWGSEITIQNNEFTYPKWEGTPCKFLTLEGSNVKIIGNTFTCLDGVLGEFSSTFQKGSVIAHNTFRNIVIGGSAEKFIDNTIIVNNKDEERTKGQLSFSLGGYKEVSGNDITINGTSIRLGICGKFMNNKIRVNNFITQPTIGIWKVETPIHFKGNEIYTDKPMKDALIMTDGRIDSKVRIMINIEDNYMDIYDPTFIWIRPYWTNTKYENCRLSYRKNFPNRIGWDKSNMTPITGDYYNEGDIVQTDVFNNNLTCIKAGYYSAFEWSLEDKYKYGNFVVYEGIVYKCVTTEKELQVKNTPKEDNSNWQSFGEVAEFNKN